MTNLLRKSELRSKCTKEGIAWEWEWSINRYESALAYHTKTKYADVKVCTTLVIGGSKYMDYPYVPAGWRSKERVKTAFVAKGNPNDPRKPQNDGTVHLNDVLDMTQETSCLTKIVVVDPHPLMLYRSNTHADTKVVSKLRRLVRGVNSIVLVPAKTRFVAERQSAFCKAMWKHSPLDMPEVIMDTGEPFLAPGWSPQATASTKSLLDYPKRDSSSDPAKKVETDIHGVCRELDRESAAITVKRRDVITSSGERRSSKYKERIQRLLVTDPASMVDSISQESCEYFLGLLRSEEFVEKFARAARLFAAHRYRQYRDMAKIYGLPISLMTDRLKSTFDTFLKGLTVGKIRKDLRDCFESVEDGFASIIGRESVKSFVVRQLVSFSGNWRSMGKTFTNVCITGPSGSGKTRVCSVLAKAYTSAGVYIKLTGPSFHIVTRCDLVGTHIGQTAPKTRAVLLKSLEGVLFIDEAYQLAIGEDSGRDFGREAVAELVNFLDKHMGCLTVIVAGYKLPMEKNLFATNEGLKRRFPLKIELENYSSSELTKILLYSLVDYTIDIPPRLRKYIAALVREMNNMFVRGRSGQTIRQGVFNNQGGDMLNLGSEISRELNALPTLRGKVALEAIDRAGLRFLASKRKEFDTEEEALVKDGSPSASF